MESDATVKRVQVTAEELEAIRGVLQRVDALGRGDPDLIDRVAVAVLDGPDLVFGLSNDWDVMRGAWQDVVADVGPPDNGFGPRAREFGMRLSDAAHAALDEWEEADRHGR